jgi:hypothetical protein
MIAALYVKEGGPYYDLPDVDPWPESRDARNYPGPWPVVAHPPCSRWCRLAGLVEARYGHRVGDDGGCFASALEAVRRWGGVLEHPAFTKAWTAHGLPRPATYHGWHPTFCGGWVCYVEQYRYGHAAKKATWLYAVTEGQPPELRWGLTPELESTANVSWCGNRITARSLARIGDFHTGNPNWSKRRRLSPTEASATPPEFRDALLSIATIPPPSPGKPMPRP